MEAVGASASTLAMSSYWSALYAEHAAALASFLRKLTGDPEVASELVQETFVRAIRSGRGSELRTARAWLFRVAGNLARDHARRRRLLRFVPFSGREVDPARIDPDADLVHRALRRLPPTLSTTLLLHYEAGFSRREIADMDGVTEEAVKARLARGRDAFARAFEQVGGDLR